MEQETNKGLNQETFNESKELRDRMSERHEVLEKVKDLLLIPWTEYATLKQVAEYYEVEEKAVEKICSRHLEELESDGMCVRKHNELLIRHNVGLKTSKGKVTILFENGETFDYPNRGLKVFPRRAILRVGMLLRDSRVAKEIRTQLLNIEEKVSEETKIEDVVEEQTLMLAVGMAYASGSMEALMEATTKYNAFQNRHIKQLENDNKALSASLLEWEDRDRLNAGIRKLASVTHIPFGVVWNELYKNLQYKYGIHLKRRGKTPYIQWIEEHEWNKVIKTFCAMCEAYGQSPTKMFQQTVPVENLTTMAG